MLKSNTKECAFNYSGNSKKRREVTQVLSGGESLALEMTVLLLHFIPGNYRPSIVFGMVSKEPRKVIRGKEGKDISVTNGRIRGTGMKKGNRRHDH